MKRLSRKELAVKQLELRKTLNANLDARKFLTESVERLNGEGAKIIVRLKEKANGRNC